VRLGAVADLGAGEGSIVGGGAGLGVGEEAGTVGGSVNGSGVGVGSVAGVGKSSSRRDKLGGGLGLAVARFKICAIWM
jgi:hypothetical protein